MIKATYEATAGSVLNSERPKSLPQGTAAWDSGNLCYSDGKEDNKGKLEMKE